MIKEIFDEIANESSTNGKMRILSKYKDNETLEKVLYLTYSKRIKFYIKQIPSYERFEINTPLSWGGIFSTLNKLITREVTGHDATNLLVNLLQMSDPNDALVIERIIEKDAKIGMGTRNINKVFPKLIETTPYMGCKSYKPELIKKVLEKESGFVQIKMDGRYCNAIIENGEVELESRQGEPSILTGANFINELTKLPDCVLNGELIMRGIPRYESNGIIISLIDILKKMGVRSEKETKKKINEFTIKNNMTIEKALNLIDFVVWDKITIDEYYNHHSSTPYNERFSDLITILNENNIIKNVLPVESYPCKTYEEVIEKFQKFLNDGEEGAIFKSYSGEWKNTKPNHQIKMKLEMNIDLEVIGFNYGTGKNKDVISSLNCQSSDGLLKTSPTGIKEDVMLEITKNQDNLKGTIVEVKCSGLSWDRNGDYSLLHPVFKGFRDGEKDVANSLEEIKDIEKMFKGLK